ncbi:YqgE/AlgH family protein [Actinotalea sp. M2MS4P-6]|uniref:YqgE/AlgH family protein n=1 Tax=Actinotalea sp. M2MS4P-6 TaxID=2983762 RepID=UPI0021E4738A|nr:YqgE/AlgH family protein [Actinotalea sp. M2MS4P-6]MCV2394259.1 YqgE/AlgH family protein [Actinotalea sp. M2MS4P-6]
MSSSLTGRLLVAAPGMRDPNFARSVVLLLDHGDDGAFGVVINRPLEVDVDEVLPDWQPFATPPGRLFQGGPVGLDGALGVVLVPDGSVPPPGVDRVTGPFGLVDLDTPTDEVASRLGELRVFAGHSGWSGGQLEAEIARGDWLVLAADERDPFSGSPERLWSQVLRRQGGDLALFAGAPVDPRLN